MAKICVLCGTEFEGHGHNPAPLNQGHGRCCDECNTDVVIPKRLMDLQFQLFVEKMNENEKLLRAMMVSESLNK
tara:strand:- start:3057 stop:3278 length:222 start_codon:yes stop_codon:yes gene_type:complete